MLDFFGFDVLYQVVMVAMIYDVLQIDGLNKILLFSYSRYWFLIDCVLNVKINI